MWLMGDIIEAELKNYGRGKDYNPNGESSVNVKTEYTFPLIMNHSETTNQSAANIYNITLTDDQFIQLLDTIKSLYR